MSDGGSPALIEALKQGLARPEDILTLLDDAAFETSGLNDDLKAQGASAETAARLKTAIKLAVLDWLMSCGFDEPETAREGPTDGEIMAQIRAVAKAAAGLAAALRGLEIPASLKLHGHLLPPVEDLMGDPIPERAINRTPEPKATQASGLIARATGQSTRVAPPDLSAVLDRMLGDLALLVPALEQIAQRPAKRGRQDKLVLREHLWRQVIEAWHEAAKAWPTAGKTDTLTVAERGRRAAGERPTAGKTDMQTYKATSSLPNAVRALVRGATGSEPPILTDDSFLSTLADCKAGDGILGAVRRDGKRARRRKAPSTAAKPKRGKRKTGA
jgi:hypothetical protein